MFKKVFAAVVALCMVAALTVTASADAITLSGEGAYAGAFIDTSILTEGEAYTLEIYVQLGGVTFSNGGLRVRYHNMGGPDDFVDDGIHWNDGGDPNKNPANSSVVSSGLPAHIPNETFGPNDSFVFTVNFIFGDDLDDMDNTEWISVLGFWGDNDYEVTGLAVKNASGAVIAQAGEIATAAPPPAAPPADDAPSAPAGDTSANVDPNKQPDSGVAGVATVAALAVVSAAGVVLSVKKKK